MIAFIVVFTMSFVIICSTVGLLLSEKFHKKAVLTDNSSQTEETVPEWKVVLNPEENMSLARII
jgi:hypothetical protein